MKPREPRRKLVVGARMRLDGRWADVRILDASSRGFLIATVDTPNRGTYIELARGPARYVARVMWQGNGRCGVQTQDRVCVGALLKPPECAANDGVADAAKVDRRGAERSRDALDQQAARSVWIGKSVEYAGVVGMGAVAAMLLYAMLGSMFAAPLSRISSALEDSRP